MKAVDKKEVHDEGHRGQDPRQQALDQSQKHSCPPA